MSAGVISLDDVGEGGGRPGGANGDPGVREAEPSGLRRVLVLADASLAAAAWGIALIGPVPLGKGAASQILMRTSVAGLAALATLAFIAGQRLYLARVCAVRAVELQRLGQAVALAALLVWLAAPSLSASLPAVDIAIAAMAAFIALAGGRSAYRAWLASHRRSGRFARPVVIVGVNDETAYWCRLLEEHPEIGFEVVGVVGPRPSQESVESLDAPWLGELDEAVPAIRAAGASGALVVATALHPDDLNRTVRWLADSDVHVHLSSGLRGIAQHRLLASPLAHEPLFYLEPAVLSRWQISAKRVMDVALGGVALLAALPVLAVAAVAIKLEDRGPLLFRQQRVGRGGELFTLFKLRTMGVDAEDQQALLREHNMRDGGPLFKLAGDPRVTRVGRLLRTTSIDELPQLLNVLRGDMSLVGPRPALPQEVEHFDLRLQMRTHVPPGITGLWQVEARDNPAFGPYRRLDLFYVDNWSVGLDLGILAATVGVVMGRALRTVGLHPVRDEGSAVL